jgi:hypothetical protein
VSMYTIMLDHLTYLTLRSSSYRAHEVHVAALRREGALRPSKRPSMYVDYAVTDCWVFCAASRRRDGPAKSSRAVPSTQYNLASCRAYR